MQHSKAVMQRREEDNERSHQQILQVFFIAQKTRRNSWKIIVPVKTCKNWLRWIGEKRWQRRKTFPWSSFNFYRISILQLIELFNHQIKPDIKGAYNHLVIRLPPLSVNILWSFPLFFAINLTLWVQFARWA